MFDTVTYMVNKQLRIAVTVTLIHVNDEINEAACSNDIT